MTTDNFKIKKSPTDLTALNQALQPAPLQCEIQQETEKLPSFGKCMMNAAREVIDTWMPTSRTECVNFAASIVRSDEAMENAYADYA